VREKIGSSEVLPIFKIYDIFYSCYVFYLILILECKHYDKKECTSSILYKLHRTILFIYNLSSKNMFLFSVLKKYITKTKQKKTNIVHTAICRKNSISHRHPPRFRASDISSNETGICDLATGNEMAIHF
jgi:hypothetical protein